MKCSDLFNWGLCSLKLVMKVGTQLLTLEAEYLGAYSENRKLSFGRINGPVVICMTADYRVVRLRKSEEHRIN